jgi:hypothetical protein
MLENLNEFQDIISNEYSIDIDLDKAIEALREMEKEKKTKKDIVLPETVSTIVEDLDSAENEEANSQDLAAEIGTQQLFSNERQLEIDNTPSSLETQTNNFSIDNNFGWVGNLSKSSDDRTHLLICDCSVCHGQPFIENVISSSQTSTASVAATTMPLSSIPSLSSNPNAKAKIYLDFNGHTTTNTSWNSWIAPGKNIITPAYDSDGNTSSFSSTELSAIQQIWQRVAEDYAPFNIDVTTVAPASYGAKTAVRVAIGGSASDWYSSGAGGVAFIGSFQWSGDTPAFVFTNNLGKTNAKNIAEAVSHEAGHTLGLRHQSAYDASGKRTQEYSGGSGTGETGWAPIMGVSYSKNLTTWNNGPNNVSSTSLQDDMSIISGTGNGFGYRQDDRGNSIGNAANLTGTTQVSGSGIIETVADVDVFRFTTGAGNVTLDVKGASVGQNLDIVTKLLDSTGKVLVTSDASDKVNANISTSLSAGTYYLQVGSNGLYGRVGQYTISGTLPQVSTIETFPEVSINDINVNETNGTATFTVSLSKAATNGTSVNFTTANGTAASGEDYTTKTGTLNFATGETSKTITVDIQNDSLVESEETFSLKLSNPQGLTIKDDTGVGKIVSEDVYIAPEVSINDISVNETNGTATFTVSLSKTATSGTSVNFATANGTAVSGEDYTAKTGTLNFAAGETSKTITVDIQNDSLVESEETFSLKLNNPQGLTIQDDTGVGAIVSEDVPTPVVMGETGRFTGVNHELQTITFQNTYTNPVVFAQPLSRNGMNTAVVRITDITANSFSFFVDEPSSYDGFHLYEDFSFMVMEAGTWSLENGATIQVGAINTNANVNNNWQNVQFGGDFSNTPAVLTQVQSDNGDDFVRTRQQNASADGFSLGMEKEESLVNSAYSEEKIGWLAMTSGVGDWNGFTYQAANTGNNVTDAWSTVNFAPDFKEAPQLLANVSSYNDSDSVGLRYRRIDDVKVDIMLDEDEGLDSERTHGAESVSFLALDGSGTLKALKNDTVAGAMPSAIVGGGSWETSPNINSGNLFVLGDSNGSFYSYRGDADYALISNFQVDRDIIQLYGSATDYRLAPSAHNLHQGTAIFNSNNDLIGIVKGTSSLDLNSPNFNFV